MKEHPIQGQQRDWALQALQQSSMFGTLGARDIEVVLSTVKLYEYEPGEVVMTEGEPADSGYLVLHGEGIVTLAHSAVDEQVEVGRINPSDLVGEMGLLLEQKRTATVSAASTLYLLRFGASSFDMMMDRIQGFARQLSNMLARRLAQTSRQVPLKEVDLNELGGIDEQALHRLSANFIQRHRVLPLKIEGNILKVGFVDDPKPNVISSIRRMLPGQELSFCNISNDTFESVLRTHGLTDDSLGLPPSSGGLAQAPSTESLLALSGTAQHPIQSVSSPSHHAAPEFERSRMSEAELQRHLKLSEPLLHRMVAEGASDLHLCARQKPRWRIDGELLEISDHRPFDRREVYEMLKVLLPERSHGEFAQRHDTDFSYSIPGLARYRVNMYEDENGVSAALRTIPISIPSIEQLQLPPGIQKMAEAPHGLVLVTGPTGSGKSTTLAALINHINQNRGKHIITLEDPVEFIHPSAKSLVNQREIGTHAKSFSQALRASMREDPDIILVGELRDPETMQLALETANTGHLVFGTLHTNTALSTIDRIIDMFPADLHHQIRSTLSDVLVGIVSQILCKKKNGGRTAAFEVLLVNQAISSLIRQGKPNQIINVMGTDRLNLQLNTHLEQLVRKGDVSGNVALESTFDPEDLKKRLPRTAIRTQPTALKPQQ